MPDDFIPNDFNYENQIDAFLDGSLSDEARVKFERAMDEDPRLSRLVQLQRRIDASLRASFSVPATVPQFDLRADVDAPPSMGAPPSMDVSAAESSSTSWSVRSNQILWAAAAICVWGVILHLIFKDRAPKIEFVQRPVAEIYQECVAGGFRPYWDCNGQEERFAATFEQRVGKPLALGELPQGCRMAGVSYLQAITRNTTAMLAYCHDKPVIVFVDRVAEDHELTMPPPESGLRLHRKVLDGLVIYELTPEELPSFLDALTAP